MTAIIALTMNFAIMQGQISSLKVQVDTLSQRQDRQGTTIAGIQTQVTGLANDISGIKATLNSVNENVNYIRNRIDRVTQ